MIVINLFGAPGAGKSTGAAYIFAMLKMKGYNVELITEYAKELVWEDNLSLLNDSEHVFEFQSKRQKRVKSKVDVIITDSPLLLSIIYNTNLTNNFKNKVVNEYNTYNNINYYIKRNKPYNPKGRLQNEKESDELNNKIYSLLNECNIICTDTFGDINSYNKIVDDVSNILQNV